MSLAKYKVHIAIATVAMSVFLVNKHFGDQIKQARYKPLVGQIEAHSDNVGEELMQEITPLVHIAAYNESLGAANIDESVFTAMPAPVEVEPVEVEAAEAEEPDEPEAEVAEASEWDAIDGRIKLQSIFGISGSRRGAIINGRGRHMGDTIILYSKGGGITKVEVKAISDRSVLLAINDDIKEFTL